MRMNFSPSTTWARHPAMATLPKVAQQRQWLQSEDFTRYGIDWARGVGMGGPESVGTTDAGLLRSLAQQWFHPLTLLSPSAAAALRSASASLSDEVLPPVFPYDIPEDGTAFLPSTLHGNTTHGNAFGVSVISWTHCYIGDAPGVFITAWVSDDFRADPDIAELRRHHAAMGGGVRPRFLLKHAEPLLCGTEATYGKTVRNPHREETAAVGDPDPDPSSLTHRLVYALWSMLASGSLVASPPVTLPPRTAQLYQGDQVHALTVAGVRTDESLLTVRKDRVEDFYDDRNLFVWSVSAPRGGRVL